MKAIILTGVSTEEQMNEGQSIPRPACYIVREQNIKKPIAGQFLF